MPSFLLGTLFESVAQSCVGRYTTRQGYMVNAGLFDRQIQLLHQYVNDGAFKRGCQILFMVFNKVGVFLNLVAQEIQKRCFQSRKTIVKSGYVRLGKFVGVGIALTCEFVNDRSARIEKSHHLGAFIHCFARSIVNSLS